MNASEGAERAGRRELVFVAILLLVGFWLRLYALDQYPLGVHQDELSNIYDGYSISETGADRFGDKYPLQVRGFGERDYRPSLYAWLAAVPIRLSGFSVTAGRLPSAIFGFASLVLLYGFARRMGGATFGVLALLLGVLSPLHIQYSRVAHEGSMLPAAFLIFALLLWQRAAIAQFAILPTAWVGLAIGISANPYQSSRLTAPLMAAVFMVDILRHATKRWHAAAAFAAAAFIGALPQVVAMLTDPEHFFARARLLSSAGGGAANPFWTFVSNFGLNLEPVYLFVPREIADLSVARLLPAEIFFFYLGLVMLAFLPVRSVGRARWIVYAALAITLLPAVLTEDNPNT
ncbi:MAG: glycosyltransferase family 39 protein, partial [Gemmatimonadota bacterium]|nr:glycosyltransferase family 39 protein [Gemmatimonadota bacterium]